MNKLIGVKWGALSDETKSDLLEKANCIDAVTGDNVRNGECTVDLTDELSIIGKVEDYEIMIDDESIIYNPVEGIELDAVDLPILDINNVMTVTEASERWGITEGAIRAAIKAKKFILGIDYRKAGRITLISVSSMERVYGEIDIKDDDE